MMVYLVVVQGSWLGYLGLLCARRDRRGIDGVGDGIVGRDAGRGDRAAIVAEPWEAGVQEEPWPLAYSPAEARKAWIIALYDLTCLRARYYAVVIRSMLV